ncbi:MAG TPA: hypothetical protein VIN17_03850 [Paracoccaceae bacterium]|jgi:hypothetical protein|nr:hypothetical protein [Paracoccaceae bacterium]
MFDRLKLRSSALVMLVLAGLGLPRCDRPAPLDIAAFDALYADPAPVAPGPKRVYFIGHSLIGRDMPAMLAQLSAADNGGYESQLGWGASLKSHWEPDVPVNGFEVENAHPRYRDAREAVASGDYDAVVMTEMVEIRDAIKYMDSHDYLHRFARAAWEANPETRVYFYETWHPLSDPEGWLERVDLDLERYWEGEILRRALAHDGMTRPIHLIPAGQVMARLVREIEAGPGLPGLKDRTDLFIDDIHLSDQGLYLVALTHYAVIHQRSPEGLPHALLRADNTPADAPDPEAAALMQRIVWDVVQAMPRTGVPRP